MVFAYRSPALVAPLGKTRAAAGTKQRPLAVGALAMAALDEHLRTTTPEPGSAKRPNHRCPQSILRPVEVSASTAEVFRASDALEVALAFPVGDRCAPGRVLLAGEVDVVIHDV